MEPLLARKPELIPPGGVPSRRIFLDLTTGFMAGTAPSGLFPDGGVDPHVCASSSCCGEAQGPDRVFCLLSRVSSVKVTDLSFIPLFSGGYLYYVTAMMNESFQALRAAPFKKKDACAVPVHILPCIMYVYVYAGSLNIMLLTFGILNN
jgi:hypothetical protein